MGTNTPLFANNHLLIIMHSRFLNPIRFTYLVGAEDDEVQEKFLRLCTCVLRRYAE